MLKCFCSGRQRLDQLVLRHLRAAGNLRLARALVELRPRKIRQIGPRAAATAGRLDARAERLEQVGRRLLLGLRGTTDLFAGSLRPADLAQGVPVRVLVLLGLDVTSEVV